MMIHDIIQICMGMFGAIGFAVLFHVQKEKLIAIALGGALSRAIYLIICKLQEDKVLGLFVATVTVALLAEILARILKAPVTILLVPMLIPLFPGSDLFYTTSYFVHGQMTECIAQANFLLKSACAIAFGILCVTCLFQMVSKIGRRRQH